MSSHSARFGPFELTGPAKFAHYLLLGGTGSGKSTLLNMLLNSVLNEPANLPPSALVYDPKREFLPILDGIGRKKDCIILNPMDERCASWDLAKDITDPIAAREFATILTLESTQQSSENRFFTNAVKDFLTACVIAFINLSPGGKPAWTFRDLILTCLYPNYLVAVLSHERDAKGRMLLTSMRVKQVYLDEADPRTKANIWASIQSALGVFEPIAAVWDNVQQRQIGDWPNSFALTDWLDSGEILVLGNDETARASLDPINQAIFQRASGIVLGQPAQSQSGSIGRTWFFLDEVREAGKFPALSRLMNKARSHGVSVVLAFQDLEGLKAEYGEHIALEIVAQCNNKAILRVDSPESARWAASLFGDVLGPEPSISSTFGAQSSRTISHQRMVRQNVYSSEISFMEYAGVENGIPAYYKHGEQDGETPIIRKDSDWSIDIKPYLPRPTNLESFIPHSSPDVFYLKPFTTQDWSRLGLDGVPPPISSKT